MKYLTPTLETERLILKKGQFSDYQKVYEYDLTKLRDIGGEFEFVKLDPKEISGFDTYAEKTDGVFDWILYLKENGTPIGNIVASREVEEIKATELSFNLHPTYWGKGYMKEAVIAVLEYLFQFGFENVLAGYDEGNIKSKRVQEKIGFSPYKVVENSWFKNGVPITLHQNIMSKESFSQLYKKEKKK